MMNETIRYIIRFLLGEHVSKERSDWVGYTSDPTLFGQYKAVIIPSGFFDKKTYGTADSLPTLPLSLIENTPLLFGQPQIERVGDTLVIHADLVASAYFLLSRYEEMIRRNIRDAHGRFPGRESLPFRAEFIHRPVVDEYGRLLRKWLSQMGLNIAEPPVGIRKVYLTHDVDIPWACRTWRNVARGLYERQKLRPLLRAKLGALENDVLYTFPWLLEADRQTALAFGEENCLIYLFFKAGGNTSEDWPRYNLRGKDLRKLYALAREHHANPGLHSSYRAGKKPSCIKREKKRLQEALGQNIYANRHHFLAAREPEDMDMLERLGFEDDFTMGYADVAGFRLGTARPVHRINAAKQSVSLKLLLHPMTLMDVTLTRPNYMGLLAEEALAYTTGLIEQIKQFNGELTLLWHNTSVIEGPNYLKDLYIQILKIITTGNGE
jgi:hypothetical protein